MAEMRATITQLTKLVSQLSAVATEQSAQLTRTQETLRRTIASVDTVKIDSTLTNVRATSAQLEQLSRDLKETNSKVQGVIDKASTGNGTVGRLMNDDALYRRLDTLLLRFDSLAADIKKNPRKYINLRIF